MFSQANGPSLTLPLWPLAAPALLLLLAWAGRALVDALAPPVKASRGQRLVLAVAGGCLLLHVELSLLDLAGWRWRSALVLAPLAAAGVAGLLLARRRAARRSAPVGWGDALALVATGLFAALGWTGWITIPDFIYHWGLKGHRYLLAGHVDYAFLAQPLGWVFHPDYPNLYPELLATTAMLAGWREPALLLWSPLLLLLVLLSVREVLVDERVAAARRHAIVAFTACGCAAFAIGNLMAGAADWLPALALAAALPALLAPPSTAGDAQLGLCAGLAAAAKQEGLVLAVLLVAVQLSRRLWRGRRPDPRGLAALLGPPVLVLAYSWWRIAQHQLLQSYDKGLPTVQRLLTTLRVVAEELVAPEWYGLSLLLLVLPLLLALPRLRPFATIACLQLAAYVASCAGQDADTRLLVVTTFTRLVLQLWPATVAAAAVALFGVARQAEHQPAPAEVAPAASGAPPAATPRYPY
jgi:hypothetical protein